jgi:hypothetical protein
MPLQWAAGDNARDRSAESASLPHSPPPYSSATRAIPKSQNVLKHLRIEDMAMADMSAEDCFEFVSHHVPFIKPFKTSWQVPGSMVADVHTAQVMQHLQTELSFLPRVVMIEIICVIQAKHSRDVSVSIATMQLREAEKKLLWVKENILSRCRAQHRLRQGVSSMSTLEPRQLFRLFLFPLQILDQSSILSE